MCYTLPIQRDLLDAGQAFIHGLETTTKQASSMQASQSSTPLRLIAPPFFPSTPQDQAQPSHKPILCKLYPTPQGCSFGQACRFMHEKPGDVSLRNAKPGQWKKRVAKERKALNDKHSKGARARSGELISRFERLVGETKALPAGSGTKVSNKTCKFFQAGEYTWVANCADGRLLFTRLVTDGASH